MMNFEEFNKKFHSLEGITLKDKKKSLHFLLKSITSSDSAEMDDIIQRLKPSSFLEETYKIDLLLHSKRTTDLLEILINGDEMGAYKIVRQNWFVRELLDRYTPSEFIKELIPKFSFSIRSMIFKKILMNLKNEIEVDQFFEETLDLYGISSAIIFLPGCPTEKIEKIFEKYLVIFSVNQLKFLFKKDINLIVKYFHALRKKGSDLDKYKWRSFFSYMGKQNPLFYFELCEKFCIDKLKLGRQSTKKYINFRREEIVKKPLDHYKFLRKDVLVRKLGLDFPIFFRNLLPDNLYQFKFFPAKSLLKYYPKKRQYQLYINTFEEVYKKSLWDNTEYMDEKLIELIPDKDDREKWVLKFENRQNIKKYMLKRKKCAMFFREDDDNNIIKEKKTIFNTLISTCKLTKDYDAFLNILKSFCERHRNSDVTIIYNFLRTIHKELDLGKFKDEHWKYIYFILSIQLFKKQQIFHPIFLEYIKFQYLNGKPIDDYMLTLLNEAPVNMSKFNYNNKDFEKCSHLLFLKFLPKITNKQKEIAIQIALSLMRWNAKFPSEAICFSNQKDILKAVSEFIASEKINNNVINVFRYLICNQKENEINSDLDDMYWSNYEKLNDSTITNWFLKYKPMVFKENINKIRIILNKENINFVHNLKKYSHLGIPNSITTLCLQELEISDSKKCGHIVRILVLFMEKADLYSFMLQYIPEIDQKETDVVDENTRKSYAIQCALAKYCKLSVNVKFLLPALLKYCKGNVLSSSLPSLYSIFHRVPENQLHSALQTLNNGAVSVRKHSIFLTSLIFPKKIVLTKYNQVQSFEKNRSVKQHMFSSCLKYFIKNELPECWDILKNYLTELEKGQKDLMKIITNVHLISENYRSDYTELVWNTLEKLKTDKAKIDDNMFYLLNNLEKNDVKRLNIEFCCNIIETKLFDIEDYSIDDKVSDFCRKFLLFGRKSEKKVDTMLKVINFMKKKSFNDPDKLKEMIYMLHKFCSRLFTDILSIDAKNIDFEFIKNFQETFVKIFSVEEIFEEILLFDLILFKIESTDFKESLPSKMSILFSSLLEKYGNLVMKRYRGFLKLILNVIYPNERDESGLLNFFNSFLEEKCTLYHCALVIELMPYISVSTDTQASIDAYGVLLRKLNEQDRIIKICLYGKLKNM